MLIVGSFKCSDIRCVRSHFGGLVAKRKAKVKRLEAKIAHDKASRLAPASVRRSIGAGGWWMGGWGGGRWGLSGDVM